MKLRALAKDDDAVSPVIGVILMVAITVILAAVIASFVLGLGDSADEVQPNTSFGFDYDGAGTNVSATLTDGDTIDPTEIVLRGDALPNDEVEMSASDVTNDEWAVGETVVLVNDSADVSAPGEVNVDSASASASWNTGEELRIVWESSEGDDAATLAEQEVEF